MWKTAQKCSSIGDVPVHTHTYTPTHTHSKHTHSIQMQTVSPWQWERPLENCSDWGLTSILLMLLLLSMCCCCVCVLLLCVCVATVCVLLLYLSACWADQQQRAQTSVRCFAWISNCRTLSQIAPVFIYLYMLPISKYATHSHSHTLASIIFEFRKTSKLNFEIILNVLFRTQRK